jgi:hypothetical protein
LNELDARCDNELAVREVILNSSPCRDGSVLMVQADALSGLGAQGLSTVPEQRCVGDANRCPAR